MTAFGGLDLCSCKRGFFTLRDCTSFAVATCRTCSRRICQQHLSEPDYCVECAARDSEDRVLDHTADPTTSAVHYRTRWYRAGGYSPVFWGTSDSYWTNDDYRWYDDGSDYNDDDDGGGFGDS